MKAKKTIRRMTPLARKAAHLTRSVHSLQKRMENLTEEIQRVEMSERAQARFIKRLNEKQMEAENDCRAESGATIENEHEPAPPGGSGHRQNGGSDCRFPPHPSGCMCRLCDARAQAGKLP